MEKRKRAVPKRFRPAAPKPTTMHLPLLEAPHKPKSDVPDSQPPPSVPVPDCESTPWPGTGKMSGNLFEDRNWLLCQTIQTMAMKIKLKMNLRLQPVLQAPDPQLKKKNPK